MGPRPPTLILATIIQAIAMENALLMPRLTTDSDMDLTATASALLMPRPNMVVVKATIALVAMARGPLMPRPNMVVVKATIALVAMESDNTAEEATTKYLKPNFKSFWT